MRRLVSVAACGVLFFAAPAAARTVRVFVINPRVELRYAETYLNYRAKMLALVDARHPRRAELVQPGLLDIASHLPREDPSAPDDTLLVFPEDVGLVTGLIGSRGATARAATLEDGGAARAFIDLMNSYQPQADFY